MGDLLTDLETGILCQDGPDFSARHQASPPCLEALTLCDPDAILSRHAAYLAAGARLIRTNTFGANAAALAPRGLEAKVSEINWLSAQLAVQAARGTGAHVAGCVGPVTDGLPQDREQAYSTQIGALLDGRVGVILLEGFTSVPDLVLALRVKDSLHYCPAICSLRLDQAGRLPDQASLAASLSTLIDEGASVIGIECHAPTIPILEALRECRRCEVPAAVTFLPPASESGGTRLDDACAFVQAGARLIGGGSPAFTAHLAVILQDRFQPGPGARLRESLVPLESL